MEVILLETVKGLGERGGRVQVQRGYARNYLFPRRLAVAATGSGAAIFAEEARIRGRRDDKRRSHVEVLKAQLDGQEFTIRAQASDEGKLYGSVTVSEIAAQLAEAEIEVDRKAIQLAEPIKQVGEYRVEIQLLSDVMAEIKVTVEPSE